jgi:hypothetical protein
LRPFASAFLWAVLIAVCFAEVLGAISDLYSKICWEVILTDLVGLRSVRKPTFLLVGPTFLL